MTLSELRFIVALAHEKNFRRAAEKSFVSQPALSLGVKKIESELNLSLFERSVGAGGDVKITPVGQKIIDQDEAMFLSDKIVLMDEGKIIQTGTCEELYTKPKNRFVANFLGECNFFTLDSGKKISIRPECLRISNDNKNDRNVFQVDVEDVVFQGRMIKLIGNYNEQEIIASISPLEYEQESTHKDKIFLTYDNESLMNI